MAKRSRGTGPAQKPLKLGIMVSSKDFWKLSAIPCDFTELLLFGGDGPDTAERILEAARSRDTDLRIGYVHAQEFVSFKGKKRLVDISSEDEDFRQESVATILRAREIAANLGGLPVVMHPGGIRRDLRDRDRLLDNLEQSLLEMGSSCLLLENMPWFYWYEKKDRMLSNVCVAIEDFKRLSRFVDGFTLDICHGYLSKPEGDQGYCERFMKDFGSRVKHLHVSDARVPDSEGLQIGEGDIDLSLLKGAEVPVTVEIWNGHAEDGRGFRNGIERLRTLERSW